MTWYIVIDHKYLDKAEIRDDVRAFQSDALISYNNVQENIMLSTLKCNSDTNYGHIFQHSPPLFLLNEQTFSFT